MAISQARLASLLPPNRQIERSSTMISRHQIFAGVAATAVLASIVCFAADGKQQISFKTDVAYPESVTWSAKRNAFLVSSVRHGTIGTVTPNGDYATFVTDEKLVS